MTLFQNTHTFAQQLDDEDPLKSFREEFYIPKTSGGKEFIYLAGNSLGLQPKRVKNLIDQELEDWAKLGVEGHLHARKPWLPYHENLTHSTARLVGAQPGEVVVMNTLSVNLHLMMVSFYRPDKKRNCILIEGGAFPSDRYAVASQIRFHGLDPNECMLELFPRQGEATLREEDILEFIQKNGERISLILLGNVNYLTGQAFKIKTLTQAAHQNGCSIGFDLAHGAGNLELNLHEDGPDFAVWCGYKYLNSGPGALAGCFVHERHATRSLPRFEGWWGQNKSNRFEMLHDFEPIAGAEGWQLSNPPIFQMAALMASMELFEKISEKRRLQKSRLLTAYLEFLLQQLPQERFRQITPSSPSERGAQLSLQIPHGAKEVLEKLAEKAVICDFREPDVLRAAPVAFYTRFEELFQFVEILKGVLKK